MKLTGRDTSAIENIAWILLCIGGLFMGAMLGDSINTFWLAIVLILMIISHELGHGIIAYIEGYFSGFGIIRKPFFAPCMLSASHGSRLMLMSGFMLSMLPILALGNLTGVPIPFWTLVALMASSSDIHWTWNYNLHLKRPIDEDDKYEYLWKWEPHPVIK